MTIRSRGGRRLNVRLILAGVLVFAVLVGTGLFIQTVNRSYTAAIAARLITAGSPLTSADYSIATFVGEPPSDQVINNSQVNDFLGRIATSDIHTGAPLLRSDFYVPIDIGAAASANPNDPQAAQRYAYRFTELLSPNERAIVLIGEPTSALIRTGDFVDVYWITPDNTVRQLLAHKQVIYVVPQGDPAANGVNSPTGTAFVIEPLSVQEVSDLLYAETNGQVRIGLASPASDSVIQNNESTVDWMSNTYKVTLPGASPPPSGVSPTPSATPAPSGLPMPSPSAAPSPKPS